MSIFNRRAFLESELERFTQKLEWIQTTQEGKEWASQIKSVDISSYLQESIERIEESLDKEFSEKKIRRKRVLYRKRLRIKSRS